MNKNGTDFFVGTIFFAATFKQMFVKSLEVKHPFGFKPWGATFDKFTLAPLLL